MTPENPSSELVFTDTDLQRDKERNELHRNNDTWISIEPDRFEALIHRLECAEKAIEMNLEMFCNDCDKAVCAECDSLKAWRKSRGL